MVGNVIQRTFDIAYKDGAHVELPDIDPLRLFASRVHMRVQRGASYHQPNRNLRSARRKEQQSRDRKAGVGLRYIRALPCDDPDGDLFGEGLGCYAEDCAPDQPDVNAGLGNCPP